MPNISQWRWPSKEGIEADKRWINTKAFESQCFIFRFSWILMTISFEPEDTLHDAKQCLKSGPPPLPSLCLPKESYRYWTKSPIHPTTYAKTSLSSSTKCPIVKLRKLGIINHTLCFAIVSHFVCTNEKLSS